MASFFLSTFAFFIGAYFIRRYLDNLGIPKTFGRGVIVFFLALALAYGVAFVVDALVTMMG
jgi:hypothetical protein